MLALVTVWRDGLVGVSKRKARLDGKTDDLHRVYGVRRPIKPKTLTKLVRLLQANGYSSYGGVAWTVSDSMGQAIASGSYLKEQLPAWLESKLVAEVNSE